jgi:hypothetical protein
MEVGWGGGAENYFVERLAFILSAIQNLIDHELPIWRQLVPLKL